MMPLSGQEREALEKLDSWRFGNPRERELLEIGFEAALNEESKTTSSSGAAREELADDEIVDVRVLATQLDGIARRIAQPVDGEDRATLERAADRLRAFAVETRELRGQLVTYGERLGELSVAREAKESSVNTERPDAEGLSHALGELLWAMGECKKGDADTQRIEAATKRARVLLALRDTEQEHALSPGQCADLHEAQVQARGIERDLERGGGEL
jgi:hypothetical protein